MRRRVTILGRTLEGALTAAVLRRSLPPAVEVVLAGFRGEAEPPAALATLPSLDGLHGLLRFDVRDLLATCGGTFRLGTKFDGFAEKAFIQSFGDWPPAAEGVAFHQHWHRLADRGDLPALSALHLGARLAAAGKLPSTPEGKAAFGLHLDGLRYRDYLRAAAVHYGVVEGGTLVDVEEHADRVTVLFEDGERLDADLLVDCSGGCTFGDPAWHELEDGSEPVWERAPLSENLSLTRVTKTVGGVEIAYPLSSRTLNARWRRSEAVSHGYRERPWAGRVVAIGQSACRLNPLLSSDLRIAQIGIEALLALFPHGDNSSTEQKEFARVTAEGFERLHDIWRLHALLSQGEESTGDGPLARKIEQFRSRGRLVTLDGESYDAGDHLSIFTGYGIVPERYDPLARRVPEDRARRIILEKAEEIEAVVASARSQGEVMRALSQARRRKTAGRL